MTKQKKRMLISVALMIFCVSILSLMLTCTSGNIALAEEIQQIFLGPSKDLSFYHDDSGGGSGHINVKDGLGMGINVITAKTTDEVVTGYSILDQNALNAIEKNKIYIRTNDQIEVKGSNSQKVLSDLKSSYKTTFGFDISGANLSFLIKGSTGAALDFSNYQYKYYNMYSQIIQQYRMYLNDYLDKSIYQQAFTTNFLTDLQKLEDKTMTIKEFFNRYGTHLIGEAIFGGELISSYTVLSNDIAINKKNEFVFENEIKFPVYDSGIVMNIANELNYEFNMSVSASQFKSNYHFNTIGGTYYSSSISGDYTDKYNNWAQSVTDDNSTLIGYTNDGLVPLWNILPDNYADLANEMEHEYIDEVSQLERGVLEEFKTGNYTDFAGGSGDESDPYLISDAIQMKNIEKDLTACYRLVNDVDLYGYSDWVSIGGFYAEQEFTGIFDGNNKKIKNMRRTSDIAEINDRFYFGLFGSVGKNGVVKNVSFENVYIYLVGPAVNDDNARVFVGTVAGRVNGGTVKNVTVTNGTVLHDCCTNGIAFVGGLIGLANNAVVNNCINYSNVTGGRYFGVAGGIAGYSDNTRFEYCQNYGNVSAYCTSWFGSVCTGGISGMIYYDGRTSFYYCTNNGVFAYDVYSGCDDFLKRNKSGDMYAMLYDEKFD